jgi:hypothetical protein
MRSKTLDLSEPDGSTVTVPMGSYIGPVAHQMATNAIVMPPEAMLQRAEQTLAVSPVPGYPGFISDEIRTLAAYRCQHLMGVADLIWQAIINAAPEAWMYAVHEAAEIEALTAAGIDLLQRSAWERHMPQAHAVACIVEAGFLKAWADYLGYNTTTMALEINNPVRKQFTSHRSVIVDVQYTTGWEWPNISEEADAVAFFQEILL